MQQQKSLSPLPQGYPLYIKGDHKLIRNLKLTLSTTLSFPKSIQIHIPFIPKSKQNTALVPLLEPIIYLEIIDDNIREQVIKKKYQLKPDTFYIYYPTEFRVDEKIYKGLIKNYENLVDQLPRSFKPYLHKLILWQQGKGQHSIQYQKHKINESLSQISKQQIQLKLNSFISQIKTYQSQPSTSKSLLHIFVLKNKLSCLYNYLSLREFTHDLLNDVWNQMMINFRVLMKLKENNKFGAIQKLEVPQDIPKLPYIFDSTNDILGYFQSNHSTAYLRIVTHAFIKDFKYCLGLALDSQALAKLKYFMDFVLNNVLVLTRRNQWSKKQMGMFDLARNLWAVQVITKCVNDFQSYWDFEQNRKQRPKSNNSGQYKIEDIAKYRVSIMSMLRNSVQRIGLILYSFDNYSIFPTIIRQQIKFTYEKIKKLKQPWRETRKSVQSIKEQQIGQIVEKTASLIRREQFVLQIPQIGGNQLKIRELISEKMVPSEEVTKILVSFQAYSQVYLAVLQKMYEALKSSPFQKVSKSLKLTLERATIMLGDWQDYQKVHDQPYQFEKQWLQLHAIEELYKLFFLLVKFLSNELPQSSQIVNQVIKILKNSQLSDSYIRNANDIEIENKNNQNNQIVSVLQIVNAVSQVLTAYGLKMVFSIADQITLREQKISEERKQIILQILLFGQNTQEILSKAKNWKLIGKQVMLGQGQIEFNLYETECKQCRKCSKCKQCTFLCLNQTDNEIYTKITSKLRLQNPKQQHLFRVDCLSFQIQTKQSSINLSINLSKQLTTNIYKINSPVLQLIDQEKPVVFAESWAPLRVRISNIVNEVSLISFKATLKNMIDGIRDINENELEINKENKKASIIISDFINLKQENAEISEQYYKISGTINKHFTKSQDLTLFLLSQKLQKIHRNSNRKSIETETNQHISLQLTFKCLKTNREYKLTLQTGSIVIKPLLQLEYLIVQTCEQFTIKNVANLELIFYQNINKDKPIRESQENQNQNQNQKEEEEEMVQICQLGEEEVVCVESRFIVISLKEFSKMKFYTNLNSWFESQHLLTQMNNTFKIWYTQQYSYEVFKPIQIESEIVGRIQIPYLSETAEQGLQIVGKISGEIQYTIDYQSQSSNSDKNQNKRKCINIWVIPVKPGNIVLPEIWIDGKRGIWANSLVTNVEVP